MKHLGTSSSHAEASRGGTSSRRPRRNTVFHFRVGHYQDACALVEEHHYSRRVPSNVQCVGTLHDSGGLFGDFGDAVAACFFSMPPTRWTHEVWELSRLVRSRPNIPLTSLISQTKRHAKSLGAHLLVSFADVTHDHHGGVYQAASWNYHARRERRMDGVTIDGSFVPGRSCNSRWGTRSPRKLSELLCKDVEPHFDEGKHLYWAAVTKTGKRWARAMDLMSAPYPKPDLQLVAS